MGAWPLSISSGTAGQSRRLLRRPIHPNPHFFQATGLTRLLGAIAPVGGAGGYVCGGCGSGRAGREVGLGRVPSLPLARREPVEGLPKTGENTGREGSGTSPIPAFGDGVGVLEGLLPAQGEGRRPLAGYWVAGPPRRGEGDGDEGHRPGDLRNGGEGDDPTKEEVRAGRVKGIRGIL